MLDIHHCIHYNHSYMMIRTQIYLPEQVHTDLRVLAEIHNTTMSELIRQGADRTIRKYTPKKKKVSLKKPKNALAYFAYLPKSRLMHSSVSAVDLVRAERD